MTQSKSDIDSITNSWRIPVNLPKFSRNFGCNTEEIKVKISLLEAASLSGKIF